MSTQSVDRDAHCTEFSRSLMPVNCEGLGWFDSISDMGAG